MCAEYARARETEELCRVGHELANNLYPSFVGKGQAMSRAHQLLQGRWDGERSRQLEEEREENRADDEIIKQYDILRGTYREPYS